MGDKITVTMEHSPDMEQAYIDAHHAMQRYWENATERGRVEGEIASLRHDTARVELDNARMLGDRLRTETAILEQRQRTEAFNELVARKMLPLEDLLAWVDSAPDAALEQVYEAIHKQLAGETK